MKQLIGFLKSRVFHVNLLAGIISVAVLLIALYFWLDFYTRHGEMVKVPNFEGKSIVKDSVFITDQGFQLKVIDSSTYIAGKPPGIILDQDPALGDYVKEGRTIYFSVTRKTPPEVQVPSLKDYSLRQAEATLRSFGLVRGEISYRPDVASNAVLEMRLKGKIIDAGTKVDRGTVIDLVVGGGLDNNVVLLPNLYGLTVEEAVFVLKSSGLNPGLMLYDSNTKDTTVCKVYRQNPQFHLMETIHHNEAVDLFLTDSEDVLKANFIDYNSIEDE